MKHKITINNIYNYIQGNGRRMIEKSGQLQEHLQEQIAYRALQCNDTCVKDGKCRVCGCDLPGRFYTTTSCNRGDLFPDLMNKRKWDEFKINNKIE
jgi:hypothetical protein